MAPSYLGALAALGASALVFEVFVRAQQPTWSVPSGADAVLRPDTAVFQARPWSWKTACGIHPKGKNIFYIKQDLSNQL